jgi:hypothetical protein
MGVLVVAVFTGSFCEGAESENPFDSRRKLILSAMDIAGKTQNLRVNILIDISALLPQNHTLIFPHMFCTSLKALVFAV